MVTYGKTIDIEKEERSTLQEFSLKPFSRPDAAIQELNSIAGITGRLSLQKNSLAITYTVSGDMSVVSLPAVQTSPSRQDELWKGTCFECFIQAMEGEAYHELNLSPPGHWNVYYFDTYRTGMREETGVNHIESCFSVTNRTATISCTLPLPWVFASPDRPDKSSSPTRYVRLGISTILLHSSGERTYWALQHPGEQPDFHDPRTFATRLHI